MIFFLLKVFYEIWFTTLLVHQVFYGLAAFWFFDICELLHSYLWDYYGSVVAFVFGENLLCRSLFDIRGWNLAWDTIEDAVVNNERDATDHVQ